jgi:hypothetical protein
VPEGDYPQLGTLGGCVDYLARARGEQVQNRSVAGAGGNARALRDAEVAARARSRW